MARGYLPYLNTNVDAIRSGASRFNATVDGVTYKGARSSQYRVWCLDELRKHYRRLTDVEAEHGTGASDLECLLKDTGIWEPPGLKKTYRCSKTKRGTAVLGGQQGPR